MIVKKKKKKNVFQFSLKKIYKKKKKEIYHFKDDNNTRKSTLSQLFSEKQNLKSTNKYGKQFDNGKSYISYYQKLTHKYF